MLLPHYVRAIAIAIGIGITTRIRRRRRRRGCHDRVVAIAMRGCHRPDDLIYMRLVRVARLSDTRVRGK